MNRFIKHILAVSLGMIAWTLPVSAEDAAGPVKLLDTNSLWRYMPVRGTEVVRMATGEIESFHPFRPMHAVGSGKSRHSEIARHKASLWTPPPAEGWQTRGFDDSTWALLRGPFCISPGFKWGKGIYRSIPMLCLRGKFQVADPAGVKDLKLSLVYQGGVAVYVNGREIARRHLPEGKLEPTSLAEDYPKEAFVDEKGVQLRKGKAFTRGKGGKKPEYVYKERYRQFKDLVIPASALKKGINIVALELHRAPYLEIFFNKDRGGGYLMQKLGWSRIGVWDVSLTAGPGAAATPNPGHAGRPEGIRVWNQPTEQDVGPDTYGDPVDPLRPIVLSGVRNGRFSGQIVVGSPKPISGLKVECTDLKGTAGVIPASQVRIRYVSLQKHRLRSHFEYLEEQPPAEVVTQNWGSRLRVAKQFAGAIQPVWFTVDVLKDTAPGDYEGTATVAAGGQKPVSIPIKICVMDWVLPDARDYVCGVGLYQSPDTLSLKYKVPMWSEKHWQLIERSFQLMGEIGCKEVYLTGIRRTHIGNEHGIIRFKREGGKLVPDFTIAEKYLALAAKHLARPLLVGLYCWEHTGTGHFPAGISEAKRKEFERSILISVLGSDGKLEKSEGPAWGTPECAAFWKPVCEGIKSRMQKLGITGEMMLGVAGDYTPSAAAVGTLNEASGGARWIRQTHASVWSIGSKVAKVGYLVSAWGGARPQDPDFGRTYGWASPDWKAVTREFPGSTAFQRLYIEAKCYSSARFPDGKSYGLRGPGRMGADFWPVEGLHDTKVKTRKSGVRSAVLVAGRYPETAWGQLNIVLFMPSIFGSGPDGAMHCMRTELFRENLQEIEARVFLEKILLDPSAKAKLGEDLARRIQDFLDTRVRISQCTVRQYLCDYSSTVASDIPGLSRQLYAFTVEAAKKMGH